VELGSLGAAPDDRAIAGPFGATASEGVLDDGLEIVLVHAGLDPSHQLGVALHADVGGLADQGQLGLALPGAELIHNRMGVLDHESGSLRRE
jgi:hypothetical protein